MCLSALHLRCCCCGGGGRLLLLLLLLGLCVCGQGVVPIIMSWFFSPILTGVAAATIFLIVRTLVMRRPNARKLVFWVLPPAVFITFFISE